MDDLENEILALMNGDTSGPVSRGRQSERVQRNSPARPRQAANSSGSEVELSDSDLDPDNVDDYGPDLMGDEEDRRRLAQMTEFEREKTLHDRAEQRQHLIERLEIRRKLRIGDRQRDGNRRSSRVVPTRDDQNRSLTELIRRREERHARGRYDDDRESSSEQRRRSRSPRDHRSSNREHSRDRDRIREREQRQRPATFDEVNAARITRDMLEKWAHKPFFEQAAVGALVRIGIGQGPDGQTVYRVCRVEGVEQGQRPYSLGNSITNLSLRCSHGRACKPFRMDIISNGAFTQREYERYMATLQNEQQKLITASHTKEKTEDFEFARNYILNDSEVEEMVRIKRSLIVFNPTLEKTRLVREREAANARNDLEEVARYDREIAEMDRQTEERVGGRQRAMMELNERNRRLNMVEARRAEEQIRQQRRREQSLHNESLAKNITQSDDNVAQVVTPPARPGSGFDMTSTPPLLPTSDTSARPPTRLAEYEQMMVGDDILNVDLDDLLD